MIHDDIKTMPDFIKRYHQLNFKKKCSTFAELVQLLSNPKHNLGDAFQFSASMIVYYETEPHPHTGTMIHHFMHFINNKRINEVRIVCNCKEEVYIYRQLMYRRGE